MSRIPHTIHYCWFGRNPLDEKSLRCIESWRKFFPDYEIIQWNEDNFNINEFDFTQKAYADKKWAFVSDVARLKILYDHGGLYFDTDVEVVSSYDDILSTTADGFMGFETTLQVNSGLGFGAVKGSPLLKSLLDIYMHLPYEIYKDRLSDIACTILTTNYLSQNGLILSNHSQFVCDFDIYSSEYFAPLDYFTGVLHKTSQTHSIHWYNASWKSASSHREFLRKQRLNRLLGRQLADNLHGIFSCIRQEGFFPYVKKRANKYLLKK